MPSVDRVKLVVEKVVDRNRRPVGEDPRDHHADENNEKLERPSFFPQKDAEADHQPEINAGQERPAAERGKIVGVRNVSDKVRQQRGTDRERREKERRFCAESFLSIPSLPIFPCTWRVVRYTRFW